VSNKVTTTVFPTVLMFESLTQNEGEYSLNFYLRAFHAAIKTDFRFVQDNDSRSSRGVLRGLRY